jgi:hypothetical protein
VERVRRAVARPGPLFWKKSGWGQATFSDDPLDDVEGLAAEEESDVDSFFVSLLVSVFAPSFLVSLVVLAAPEPERLSVR